LSSTNRNNVLTFVPSGAPWELRIVPQNGPSSIGVELGAVLLFDPRQRSEP
jgi:hypothetical protein